jgi:hypothetical protein
MPKHRETTIRNLATLLGLLVCMASLAQSESEREALVELYHALADCEPRRTITLTG